MRRLDGKRPQMFCFRGTYQLFGLTISKLICHSVGHSGTYETHSLSGEMSQG